MSNGVNNSNPSTRHQLSRFAEAARDRARNFINRNDNRSSVAIQAINAGGAASVPPAQAALQLQAPPVAGVIAALHEAEDEAQTLLTFIHHLPFRMHIPRFPGTAQEQAKATIEWMSPGENGHPDGAGHATVLACTQLNFQNTHLEALPKEIRLFRNLRALDLSFCDLETVPVEIGQLLALEHLNLCGNLQLTTLPSEMGQLIALREFNLQDVQITALPAEIVGLVSLEQLNLLGTRLASPPLVLSNLPSQCRVNLPLNRFAPDVIQQFRQGFLANQAHNPEQGPIIPGLFPDPANIVQPMPGRARLRERRQGIYVPPDAALLARLQLQFPEVGNDPLRTLPAELQSWSEEFEATFPRNDGNEPLWTDRVTDFSSILATSELEQDSLNTFLQKLRLTKNYTTPETRKDFILRVETMLQLACLNPSFRKKMLEISIDGGDSCGDRAQLIFNDIEIQSQFHSKELSDAEFRSLAIRASRYKLLTKHGQEIHKRNGGDEIEVILALHTRHREALDLPIQQQGMLYEGAAGLNETLYTEALKVIQGYNDSQLLELSSDWQDRILQLQTSSIEALTETYSDLYEKAAEYYDIPIENVADRKTFLTNHPALQNIIQKDGNHTAKY